MNTMHYRPIPRGYKVRPFIPKKVKTTTILDSIKSGHYDVIVFYTDENKIVNAEIVKKVDGNDAIPLATKLLKEWSNPEGKVEKYFGPTKRGILHPDLMHYNNLYGKLNTSYYSPIIALVKKIRF